MANMATKRGNEGGDNEAAGGDIEAAGGDIAGLILPEVVAPKKPRAEPAAEAPSEAAPSEAAPSEEALSEAAAGAAEGDVPEVVCTGTVMGAKKEVVPNYWPAGRGIYGDCLGCLTRHYLVNLPGVFECQDHCAVKYGKGFCATCFYQVEGLHQCPICRRPKVNQAYESDDSDATQEADQGAAASLAGNGDF
jgi:hypothetical protein